MQHSATSGKTRGRVLHLRVVAGTGGGPEKTILNSPRFIRRYGYDARIVYLCPPNAEVAKVLRARAQVADCDLEVLPDRGPLDVRLIFQVARLCRKHRIDILQTHDYKSNFIGLAVRRLYQCHLCTMLHGWTDMSGRMPLYKRVDQWCLPKYEKMICVSEDLVDECRKLKIAESKVHLVHNAIDVQQFQRTLPKLEAKQQLGARPGNFLIGSVGRLSPEKCYSELIDVVTSLQDQGYSIDLWIAGDGPQREELEDKIRALQRGESLRLLGQIPDTREFYQAMDLFVLNSIREGLPNVVLEAMALETSVLATNIAGIPSLIKPGETGQLIEPSSPKLLKEAILAAINNPERQARFVVNARKLIVEEFSFEVRMQKVVAIYDELLKHSKVPG